MTDTAAVTETPEVAIGEHFAVAMKIREQIRVIEELQKQQLAPFKAALAKQEAILTQHLQDAKLQNCAVPGVGTFYKSTKESFTVEDPTALRRHIVGTGAFDLLDLKVNKTAARAFVDENDGQLPPGVKYSAFVTVGMRAK